MGKPRLHRLIAGLWPLTFGKQAKATFTVKQQIAAFFYYGYIMKMIYIEFLEFIFVKKTE
jgi:hypothetical protein